LEKSKRGFYDIGFMAANSPEWLNKGMPVSKGITIA
jgi:hypothetical protein